MVRQVRTLLELSDILVLQKKNTKALIPFNEIKTQGFVTVEHQLEQLIKMQELVPQIIAVHQRQLIGYALVMPRELKKSVSALIPMFNLLDTLSYKGQAIKELSYYVMGQICIAKEFRGQGVFKQLYTAHRKLLSKQYNYCITEVSTSNLRSMQAHFALGFELLHRFTDAQDEWNIIIWDWT